jgi:hypothetical protein
MPPEIQPDKNSKKGMPFKTVGIIGTVSVLMCLYGYWYFFVQSTSGGQPFQTQGESPHELTEAEKLLKQQVDEMDRLRQEAHITSQSTTTLQSQVKTMDTMRNQTFKQKTSTQTKQTLAQQVQEMDALRAQATQ